MITPQLTYLVNLCIKAFISYGATVDGNNENDDWVRMKLQYSDTNGASWSNILNSTIAIAVPSQAPDYYGNSGSIMVSLTDGWLIRAVVWGSDVDLDMAGSNTNGTTFINIQDMVGGAVGPQGGAGGNGAQGHQGYQ